MSLLNPWWLGLLIPLAGVLILLYMLRMRRRDLVVPATFLWPERQDEVRANAPFQRLRFNWLLVLQLLALLLAVLALARPQALMAGAAGQDTVFVLDASASMGASDGSPTRFESALATVRQAVEQQQTGRTGLILAGLQPRVVFPLMQDAAKQKAALQSVERTDAEVDMGEALRLAAALVGERPSARIVLLSDGVFAPVQDFAPGKASFEFRLFGKRSDNLAVSALGVADTERGRLLFASVKNLGEKAAGGALTLYADGKPIDSRRLEVEPGKPWEATVPAPPGAELFEARLESNDLLQADNYRAAAGTAAGGLRVLLVGSNNPFLERALALDPRVTLDQASALPPDRGAGYDLVVFDNVAESETRSAGVLTFGKSGPPSPVKASGVLTRPVLERAETHPLLDAVEFEGTFVDKAENQTLQPGARALVVSRTAPIVAVREGRQRQISVAFSLLESDFPLQAGFPIFMANAVGWLAGESAGGPAVMTTGQTYRWLAAPESVEIVRDGKPDGVIALDPRGAVSFPLATPGVTTLRAGDQQRVVAASMRTELESNIEPVERPSIGGQAVQGTSRSQTMADAWKPLVLLALLVLAAEWWLFARRS